MEAVADSAASDQDDAPAESRPALARVLTPWLGSILALMSLVWASGLVVDIGINLIDVQVICAILGHAFAIIYLNVPVRTGTFK